jgi:hypothetical protein
MFWHTQHIYKNIYIQPPTSSSSSSSQVFLSKDVKYKKKTFTSICFKGTKKICFFHMIFPFEGNKMLLLKLYREQTKKKIIWHPRFNFMVKVIFRLVFFLFFSLFSFNLWNEEKSICIFFFFLKQMNIWQPW